MQNLHAVLLKRGLDRKIKVTTPHSMAVLASLFPPSASTFATKLIPTMSSIVGFLADTGAPFMVNAYPYFAYRDNPSTVDLGYALLGNSTGVHDPKGYIYHNMLDAQIDAVRSAIDAIGFGNLSMKITVSESGWPSKGDPEDTAATLNNAKTYNTRLIECTNKKPGGASERNFGIFNEDGSKLYEVDLSCEFCSNGGAFEKMSTSGRVRGPSVWEVYESGKCFEPDKLHAHASYAMNAYYQMHGKNYWNCDFIKGTGLVTFSDPSKLWDMPVSTTGVSFEGRSWDIGTWPRGSTIKGFSSSNRKALPLSCAGILARPVDRSRGLIKWATASCAGPRISTYPLILQLEG
ncbi:hypothetical protein CXB51_010089 [Gossypium anomalum]|uniref:glucan endo-1,3-beta-D-glucosidase n=1 Tax=Gossypium anomalum TaxID=47600 RepID=A0A8J6D2L1_9ROSI|nr:hypothetical protein CXB51_010089 [Gossypium anomalum]